MIRTGNAGKKEEMRVLVDKVSKNSMRIRGAELTVIIPTELMQKLKELKENYGIHYSEFVRTAIAEKLAKMESS